MRVETQIRAIIYDILHAEFPDAVLVDTESGVQMCTDEGTFQSFITKTKVLGRNGEMIDSFRVFLKGD